MANVVTDLLYVILLVFIIFFLDLKYLKNNFLKRLIVNILVLSVGIVVYIIFYI